MHLEGAHRPAFAGLAGSQKTVIKDTGTGRTREGGRAPQGGLLSGSDKEFDLK